jgi:signal transduction histidine kinase
MLAGCGQLSSLVRQIMAFVGGAESMEASVCAPKSAIDFAMATCRSLGAASGATLEYEGGATLPEETLAQAETVQDMINLLKNAVLALDPDQTDKHVVIFRANDAGAFLRIDIADNGCGMTTDVLARATEPFFTARRDGTGLGLHQCRRIVEGRGGQLSIESQQGRGTTVKLALPLFRNPESR